MEFLNSPETNHHKKALWLVFVFLAIIGLSLLWKSINGIVSKNNATYQSDEVVDKGSLSIPAVADVSTKKSLLFKRLETIKTQPLTPYEKKVILDNFSNANEMKLTSAEKTQILNALNNK